jgi:hypothetical protein
VAVTDYGAKFVAAKGDVVTLRIEDCSEVPETLTMTFGQKLIVENRGKLLVAPQFEQARTAALRVAPPGAEGVPLYPTRPGYFRMTDRLDNRFFDVDVYVLLQPLHAVSSVSGRYRIDGVPVGEAKVGARLRAIGTEIQKAVEIRANVVTNVDLVIDYVPKAAPPTDGGSATPLPSDGGGHASPPNSAPKPPLH